MAVMLAPRDDDKADSPDTGAADMGSRMAVLEVKVDGLGIKMDERFEQVDNRFEQVDKRFEQVDERFERVEGELREQRRETKAGFEKVDERFVETLKETKAGFERMLYALLTATVLIIIAMIGAPHL